MFNISGTELLLILLAALVLLGPQRIPQLLRAAGRGYREFIRMREQVDSTLSELREEIEKDTVPLSELKREAEGIRRIVRPPDGERAARGAGNGEQGTGNSEEKAEGSRLKAEENEAASERVAQASLPASSTSAPGTQNPEPSPVPSPQSPVPDSDSRRESES